MVKYYEEVECSLSTSRDGRTERLITAVICQKADKRQRFLSKFHYFSNPNLLIKQCKIVQYAEGSLNSKNQLDSFSHFNTDRDR